MAAVTPTVGAGETVSSSIDTVVNGDVVTTTTQTMTVNADDSITTTTTIDKTDHANEDNHTTTLTQTTSMDNGAESDLPKKIIRQVEYYFGDANMVKDKFLKAETAKNEGWVPLSVLTTFKRLASLTTDHSTIMRALKSSLSGLLELDETENKIRRSSSQPLPNNPQEVEALTRNRTVFVKGFPKPSPASQARKDTTSNGTAAMETTSTTTTEATAGESASVSSEPTGSVTLDDLLRFFEKFGTTENIQMQRQPNKRDFSGNVYVTFPSEQEARAFIAQCKAGTVKYDDGSVLDASSQADHYKKKAMDGARATITGSAAASGDGGQQQQKQQQKDQRKDKRKEEMERQTAEHTDKLNAETLAGAVIHLADMPADGTRELVKEKFAPFTKSPWIEYSKGETEAWVRLGEANTAKDVLEKVLAVGNGQLLIGKKPVTARVIEGEEEDKFWKENNEKRAAARVQKNDNRGRGGRGGGGRGGGGRGGGGRGGRGGGRGGGHQYQRGEKRKRNGQATHEDDERTSKSTATEPKGEQPTGKKTKTDAAQGSS